MGEEEGGKEEEEKGGGEVRELEINEIEGGRD